MQKVDALKAIKECLLSVVNESESAKSKNDNARIKKIRKKFNKLRDKPKVKEIRRNFYEVENKNRLSTQK